MIRRILIPVLISLVTAVCLPGTAPGSGDGGPRTPAAVAAADRQDDGLVCGECPEPEPGGGQAALSPVLPACDAGAARGRCGVFRRRRTHPILSSLSDSLIIGRPPPAAPANAQRTTGPFRRQPAKH